MAPPMCGPSPSPPATRPRPGEQEADEIPAPGTDRHPSRAHANDGTEAVSLARIAGRKNPRIRYNATDIVPRRRPSAPPTTSTDRVCPVIGMGLLGSQTVAFAVKR